MLRRLDFVTQGLLDIALQSISIPFLLNPTNPIMLFRGLGLLAACLTHILAFPQFPETPPVQEDPGLDNIPEEAPLVVASDDGDWESPVYSLLFRVPLPIPPVKEPLL